MLGKSSSGIISQDQATTLKSYHLRYCRHIMNKRCLESTGQNKLHSSAISSQT